MDLLSSLNEMQKEAVCATEGPVMVMAGAGAGKTKVLTTRISYIISELGILPSSILAVTFTNKAAKEMTTRISKMLNIDTKNMWVSTFHSFCARLLRIEAKYLTPYTNKFIIIDDEDSLKIVKDIMKEAELSDFKPSLIKNLISKSKNFTNYAITDPELKNTFNIVIKKYEEYLKNNNLFDFDDLIIKTIELFKNNPNVLEKYQRKFEYILVDEFQDTNTLQYDLIFMLSARHHNIFVVGDDFQSIYSFRGAKIENINKFRNDFLETKLILLEQNYRSTSPILELANSVIEHNPNQIKKKLYTTKEGGQLPFLYQTDSSYDEATFVVDKIKELVANGLNYSDIAILYRANYVSRNYEDILIKYRIPYKIYGGLSFFSRKEIKDVIAYTRLIVDNNDNFSFKRIVNEPKRKIGPALISKLEECAAINEVSLLEAIPLLKATGVGYNALKDFYLMIKELLDTIDEYKLVDLVDVIVEKTGYLDALKKDDDFSDRYDNIKELKSVFTETNENYEGSNKEKLSSFLENLALRTDNDNIDDNDNSVRLSTYHQVKGLEFKAVFMVAFEEGIFPSVNVVNEADIAEERRICYVGITRAKERLYITMASNRFLFGYSQPQVPSRFLREMNKSLFKNVSRGYKKYDVNPTKKSSMTITGKSEIKDTIKTEYKVADKVNHKFFGDGIVVKVEGIKLTIAFPSPYGVKQIMADHPAIRKIEK